jgi:serine/threonine-protein kinase
MRSAHEIHPGAMIAGKYRVRAILGRRHGLTVDAFHTAFDQRAIIKLLLPGNADAQELERFRREARALSKIASEHVARIIDVGSEPDGTFYLVRQYLEGTDLSKHVRQRGALPLAEAVTFILQAAEAVAEAHAHAIVVRDLEPAHLFVTQRAGGTPLVKITDFGTAKLLASAGPGGEITGTAMFGLTPYASPELVRAARDVDVRTDVWSLGAILYEMLAGRPPFQGEPAHLMLQITKEDPYPLSHLRPELPRDLDTVIGWALAKDVDGRFRSVHAFAHALLPFCPTEGKILVERIGQIAQAAREKKASGSVPPPSAPASHGSSALLPVPTAPPMRAGLPMPTSPPLTTADLDELPTGETGEDDGETHVFSGNLRNVIAAGVPKPSAPPAIANPQTSPWNAPEPQTAVTRAPAVAPSPPPAPPSAPVAQPAPAVASIRQDKPGGIGRGIVFGLIGLAAVAALGAVFVMKRSATPPSSDPIAVAPQVAPTTDVAAAAPAPSAAPAEPAPPAPSSEPAPTAPTAPTTTAAPAEEPVAAVKTPPTNAGGEAPRNTAPPAPRGGSAPPPAAPAEPSEEKAPPAGGGGQGTLVAVSVGGTCTFLVNGASKGRSSSLRLSLKAGTYSVTCKPATGAAKSKSVTVRPGETAMAMFKL